MELSGRRRRGRAKRIYMGAVKEDMQVVRVEYTKNRVKWKMVIRCKEKNNKLQHQQNNQKPSIQLFK